MSSGSSSSGLSVTIHQPECLPWLGFFDKMSRADVFVFLDNVQFEKEYFQNRNRVRTATGWTWLTVPVLSKGRLHQQIRDVEVDNRRDWQTKHWKTILMSYGRAPFYSSYREILEEAYLRVRWPRLVDWSVRWIRWGAEQFGIKPEFCSASNLGVEGHSSALLLAICKRLGARTYVSGISGKDYLDETLFREHGVNIQYQKFHHPVYRQQYEPFEPCMAFVDLLLNHGPASRKILLDAQTERLQTVFT